MKRTLILTIDAQLPDWQLKARNQQIADWIKTNKSVLPNENLIILPIPGESKLYWLEGEQTIEDIKTLDQIRDRIKLVLEASLGIDTKLFDPYEVELKQLKRHKQKSKR